MCGGVRLGLNLGYWGAGNDAENLELGKESDRLGYSVVWAAEAYGSDAPTVLSWVAAQTVASMRPDWTFEALPNIGHVPMMEDPEGFVRIVTAWLSRVSAPAAARSAR